MEPYFSENRTSYFAPEKKSKIDIDETVKKFKYLLGVTDLFRHFLDLRAVADPVFAEVVKRIDGAATSTQPGAQRRRKTEREEDAELLLDEKKTARIPEFTELPDYINGTLRSYQVQGLNWLIGLYENNISGILADEMGLGKTLQTISLLGYLRHCRGVKGPHIIITPKLTLDNWKREFTRWTPEVQVLVLQGTKEERQDLINGPILNCAFDVIITSYEIVIREKSTFKKFDWQYIVIDEAHRIKNEQSMLSQIIRLFHSKHRLLITGTPLQNNLHELWALLNFILPDVFGDSDAFDAWFTRGEQELTEGEEKPTELENGETAEDSKEGAQNSVVSQLHKVLQPFLLRRIKSDVEKSLLPKQEMNVYIAMSEMQRKWYQKLLEKDLDAVNGANGKKESKTRLLNIVMQLRKCCNHPYLFEGAEPGPPYTTDEHIVQNSQKMLILDKLLKKLRSEGSRVLIFSQMSRMLDILEDYCSFRGYEYCRIDGQTDHADRVRHIDEYNAPGLSKFVFLLTTRAGGLGINLTTADTVILFDSDWNPQADLQAMDRAHRIGQTKQVKVFRLITLNAVEEKILERATQKLRLDQLVIQDAGKRHSSSANLNNSTSKDQLLDMIQFGAADIFLDDKKDSLQDDLDIETILRNSQSKTQELTLKYAKLDLSALQNFSNDGSVYEWNGENFKKKEPNSLKNVGNAWINPTKRERKENYSVDLYYKDVMSSGKNANTNDDPAYVEPYYSSANHTPGPGSGAHNHVRGGPRPPKQLNIYDHQFHPPKLLELHEMEKNYYRKRIGFEPPLESGPAETLAERENAQRLFEEEIFNSRALTEEEKELKAELLTQGFNTWNRRDFVHFVLLSGKYGRNAISLISSEFEEKTPEEVREYAKVFWQRYKEIDGYERYLLQIEAGEEKIEKVKISKECLRRKLLTYRYPLQELVLKFPPATTTKRTFTDEEDRFMLVQMYKYGLDRPDLYERIRDSIKLSALLRFDFFMHSRSTAELSRRCNSLLACVLKEINPEMAAANKTIKQERISKRKVDSEMKKRKKSKLK